MTSLESPAKMQPDGVLVDRHGKPASFANLFLGAQAFAVLSGPSLLKMDITPLNRRGILTCGVNNSPAIFRPSFWTHTDPTCKFHDAIWKDPPILKFSPTREWAACMQDARPPIPENRRRWHAKGVRTRASDGELDFIPGQKACDFPGVIGYTRNSAFDPENFLWERSFNRGNDKKSAAKNGWPHCINTMFTILRLAFYLGVRTLYLLGCDFRMAADQPYAFSQGKSAGGVRSNNGAYGNMCLMLDALRPHFESAGYNVINCTPESGLWVFDSMDFSEAVARATAGIEQVLDTRDWYKHYGERTED